MDISHHRIYTHQIHVPIGSTDLPAAAVKRNTTHPPLLLTLNLIALREHIQKDSELNAAVVATRLLRAIELLEAQPAMGRPGRVLGTRELVVPGTPYLVPYRVRLDRLEIIAVFHGKQKWPAKL